ncbi:MAG: transglutaminase family protein [Armatimonadota bacterium]
MGTASVRVCIVAMGAMAMAVAEAAAPLVGESEAVYSLAGGNEEVRGLAIDDSSPEGARLLVLDASGKVFAYRLPEEPTAELAELELLSTLDLPKQADGSAIPSPRGLALGPNGGGDVLLFLSRHGGRPYLWRFEADDGTSARVDLSLGRFHLGNREALDLDWDQGEVVVCFDASGYGPPDLRVRRGVVRLRWEAPGDADPTFVHHMPDTGRGPSHGVAHMSLEGARYLWGTVGDDHIYCAEARTGRAIFHFARPASVEGDSSGEGLAFGRDALWVPESAPGPDRVHRVNVTRNLDAPYVGPKILRHLTMTIETVPEEGAVDPGVAYHNYSRPYASDQVRNQGIWPETEQVADVSDAPNATIRELTHDPGGDRSSRQHFRSVQYAAAAGRKCASRYEIDLWTNRYRKFVYPHRASRKAAGLEGTDYLADDAHLYNLSDAATYDAFIERVSSHIRTKYGAPADMDNPYWAARNVLEYIQDSYYYPDRSRGMPAAVDYDNGHYDANPGNLKIALSAGPYDGSQIIACSGTSVMLCGTMRHLGIPARWIGSAAQHGAGEWDTDGDRLLDQDETAACTNGHRYNQVWLGPEYGWMCFDATPSLPASGDFDPPPPLRSQWLYINRAAAGHLHARRVVFNVGSEFMLPLYRDFEYDERLARDNNCGGDQRYNLQGRFDRPEAWRLARHRIRLTNLCFLSNVSVSGPPATTVLTWELEGKWDLDPEATLAVHLQRVEPKTGRATDVALLAEGIPHGSKAVTLDLSDHHGEGYRLILRKEGDAETGGHSGLLGLE